MPSTHLSGYTQHEIRAFRCCICFLTPTTSESPHCLRPRPRCVDPHVHIPADVLIPNQVEGEVYQVHLWPRKITRSPKDPRLLGLAAECESRENFRLATLRVREQFRDQSCHLRKDHGRFVIFQPQRRWHCHTRPSLQYLESRRRSVPLANT